MSITYESLYATSPEAVKKYDTTEHGNEFLIKDLMQKCKVKWTYILYDRCIAGTTVPESPLKLETIDLLKADYFLERRALGFINVGDAGFGYKKSGQFENKEKWNTELNQFAACLKNPLMVEIK